MNPEPPVTTYVAISTLPGILQQADCKPSSVLHSACTKRWGDHSSRLRVSPELKQPTRKPGRAVHSALRRRVSYLALLHVGFAKPIRYRTAGALLPHLFTLTCPHPALTEEGGRAGARRCFFCCTFRPSRALE